MSMVGCGQPRRLPGAPAAPAWPASSLFQSGRDQLSKLRLVHLADLRVRKTVGQLQPVGQLVVGKALRPQERSELVQAGGLAAWNNPGTGALAEHFVRHGN